MKTLKYMLVFAAATLLLASCKKSFLELYPEGQMNEEIFFKTTADFEQALTGAYGPLRDVANIAFYTDEMRSDNTEYDYNAKDRGGAGYEQLADFLDDANNGVTATRWQADYNGISRTNVILDRLQTITFTMSDSDKNQITGEAKALRAHYYFDLVKHYGGVPLYLHEVKTQGTAFQPRVSADSVYLQIISDLSDAAKLLAPPSFPQTGRITKGMAETELALVHMTQKDYTDAIPLLKDVTGMGYQLLGNYAAVFDPNNKNNRESIFEIQYMAGDQAQQSTFIYYFIPVTPETKNILGIAYNNSHGGWNIPTQNLIDAYEPGDKRLDASIGVIDGHYNANTDYIPDSIVSIVGFTGAPAGETAKLFAKKYLHPPYQEVFNTNDNWPVYRYSGALLLLAEALNETGASSEALPYLNQVRHRAGLSDVTVTDQSLLRVKIAHERRVELALENHRWADLVRTAQAIPIMTAFGVHQKAIHGYLLPNSYHVTQDRLIYPIPFREIQVNSELTQNPGY